MFQVNNSDFGWGWQELPQDWMMNLASILSDLYLDLHEICSLVGCSLAGMNCGVASSKEVAKLDSLGWIRRKTWMMSVQHSIANLIRLSVSSKA